MKSFKEISSLLMSLRETFYDLSLFLFFFTVDYLSFMLVFESYKNHRHFYEYVCVLH